MLKEISSDAGRKINIYKDAAGLFIYSVLLFIAAVLVWKDGL